MNCRIRVCDVPDVVPALLQIVEEERSKGTIADGEYHQFKDHLFSRDLFAVRKVNEKLMEAQTRVAAPRQEVTKLAQLPRDPITNRSSFGSIVVTLVASAATPEGDRPGLALDRRWLQMSLSRAVKGLRSSFGDRLVSLTFEVVPEEESLHSPRPMHPPPVALAQQRSEERRLEEAARVRTRDVVVLQRPKMVLSEAGEWIYPKAYEEQLQRERRAHLARQEATLTEEEPAATEILPEHVQRCQLSSFTISYRVQTDGQGETIGGGINSNRQILAMSAAEPCVTGHQLQALIKGFAGCLH